MDLPPPTTVAQRANKLFQSGFIRPALDIITVELNLHFDQGELWLLRATILHSQGQWMSALAAVETASMFIPLDPGGQLVLADCYSHTGKQELALLAYEHLLQIDSLPVDYYAGLYAGFKRAGKLKLALTASRKAIDLSPENDEAYFGMAHCMSILAYPPRQITGVLRKAVELAPDKPHYRISLVIQLALTKRHSEAYGILTHAADDVFTSITCECVVRKLLDLCAWAGDETRCSRLGGVLAKLKQKSKQATVDHVVEGMLSMEQLKERENNDGI